MTFFDYIRERIARRRMAAQAAEEPCPTEMHLCPTDIVALKRSWRPEFTWPVIDGITIIESSKLSGQLPDDNLTDQKLGFEQR